MICLVTGAAGFIGSEVCRQLLAEGHHVIGIDNMNDYYDIRLKHYRKADLLQQDHFKFYEMDIENLKAVEDLFRQFKFDVVYNLAARAGVRYSMINPYIYYSTNVIGTLNLLEQVRKSKAKFILASTSSLYAGQKMPFSETLAVNTPISPYAASKKAAEVLCYSYFNLYAISVSIVRYFTVYGPAGRPDMSIFRFTKWIHDGHPLEVFGDGNQSRDFTYVADIARGTIAAAQTAGYEIFNLGGGQNPISLKKVISLLEARLGKKAQIENKEFHSADIQETWADISKAKTMLNWQPQISFEKGIELSTQWYLENQNILKDISLD